MQFFTGIVCLLLSFLANAEGIYVEVDEQGVPSYSDQKTPSNLKIEISNTMTYSDPALKDYWQHKTQSPTMVEANPVTYSAKVGHPHDNSAVRHNAGSLIISIVIEPALKQGHTAHLMKDDQIIRGITGTGTISLNNVDRGTHAFNVQIRNEHDGIVLDGPTTSITMLRHSILH